MNRVCVDYNAERPEESVYRDIPLDEWDGYDDKEAYFADKEQARYDYECKLERTEPIDRISFRNDEHKKTYIFYLSLMKRLDCYHRCVAYLIALDSVVREHIDDVFCFREDIIIRTAFRHGWQTSTSRRTLSLMFNLWNGYAGEDPEDAHDFTVDSIFSGSYSYAPFYWQAIKIRFDELRNKAEEDSVPHGTLQRKEEKNMEIVRQEADELGNVTYKEYSDGFWERREYDERGKATVTDSGQKAMFQTTAEESLDDELFVEQGRGRK